MTVQTNYVDDDKLKLYERMAAIVNLKAVSCLTFTFYDVAVGNQVMTFYIPADSTLYIVAVCATAQIAGAGGATGIKLSFSGGSAVLNEFILPGAAQLTQIYPGAGFNTPYEVPGGGFLNCFITGDDHGAAPQDIDVFLTVRLV